MQSLSELKARAEAIDLYNYSTNEDRCDNCKFYKVDARGHRLLRPSRSRHGRRRPVVVQTLGTRQSDRRGPQEIRLTRSTSMDDEAVLDRINALAEEEHVLFQKESGGEVSPEERQRLKQLEITLDQCWDLLRQRRARRSAGMDPDGAVVRDEKTVEDYLN